MRRMSPTSCSLVLTIVGRPGLRFLRECFALPFGREHFASFRIRLRMAEDTRLIFPLSLTCRAVAYLLPATLTEITHLCNAVGINSSISLRSSSVGSSRSAVSEA